MERILSQAVKHWASPFGQPEFKVLLLCDRDDEAALLRQEVGRADDGAPQRDDFADRRP
ncbi:hypothetical protein AB0877_31055 [Micromonospora sp. NPDC047644]|uniref:hypothetical protein n=1 Tax=Micromonospora sp. NPDC047644 TaxID=3157203 RepID=UPI0034525136